ncbi:MAG: hypothetical protein WCF84_03330 [Anaerolineae bacterium]
MKNGRPARAAIALATVFLLVLTACDPIIDTGVSYEAGYSTLGLHTAASRSRLHAGETIHLRFSIDNWGKQPVVIKTIDRPVMDLQVVEGVSDKLLLSWAAQHPDQISHYLEWQPGETKTIEMDWTATSAQLYRDVFGEGLLNGDSSVLAGASGFILVR